MDRLIEEYYDSLKHHIDPNAFSLYVSFDNDRDISIFSNSGVRIYFPLDRQSKRYMRRRLEKISNKKGFIRFKDKFGIWDNLVKLNHFESALDKLK